jgi:putative ABC transport system permease protein
MFALVWRTIWHFHRLLAPVAVGVAVSSAVIVGALIVGDSMRGSLRHIAMDRIGSIDRFIVAPRWFSDGAMQPVGTMEGGWPKDFGWSLDGVLLFESVVAEYQIRQGEAIDTRRATDMTLYGIDDTFWSFGTTAPRVMPEGQQLVFNQSLATQLGVQVGDKVTLKVSRLPVVPADSALGKREGETTALSRWEVIDIVPDTSMGRFSLRSDQRPVFNAFASKASLQSVLELDRKVNAIAARWVGEGPAPSMLERASQGSEASSDATPLLRQLSLSLEDLGLSLQHVKRVFPDTAIGEEAGLGPATTVFEYDQLVSDQMMIQDRLSDAVRVGLKDHASQRVLSYLANNTEVVRPGGSENLGESSIAGRPVPYSTISGVSWDVLGPMLRSAGVEAPAPGEEAWVVIHSWMARELGAQVGDTLHVDYFLPETVEGTEVERSFEVRVHAIAPLAAPSVSYQRKNAARFETRPTPFNDPAWTPEVPGITDQESISNWETPFPLDRKIERIDDEYWNEYRLTPKLFISEEMARLHFGSRFGGQTSLRYDGMREVDRPQVERQVLEVAKRNLDALGWRELSLREQQLRASSGTTPFDALFLSLSFFVIAAALLLVALLFRLTIEKRADHWGLLLASGWTRGKLRRLLLMESAVVAAVGATLGVVLGLGYAYAMLAGLRSWWVGAISVSFLEFYVRPISLWIGWWCGFLVSLLTTWIVTRQLRSVSVARLLHGRMDGDAAGSRPSRFAGWIALAVGVLGGVAMLAGQFSQGQAQAGAFVGSGMLWMIAGVLWLYRSMRAPESASPAGFSSPSIGLGALARSSAKRSPIRSILTVSLMAIASFLILSMSLFQAQPDRRGTGGFAFIGKSSQSIHINIGDPKQQRQALAAKAEWLNGSEIVNVRMRGGDDASCNNLYQANEPQVLGIAPNIASVDRDARGQSEFAWFAIEPNISAYARADGVEPSPWGGLESAADGSESSPIPVVLDQNTALWALHLGGYIGERFAYQFDQKTVHFRTVGVLQNTVLQGSLWIGESNFQKVFPEIGGYRQFLVKPSAERSRPEDLDRIRSALEQAWSDEGLSCASTADILGKLLAVQNTYLSAFQVLGALGLLLGTLGLGVTQLRSALERRSELAAMRAMGFSKNRLIWALSLENGWQLLRGIGVGLGAALLAAAPVLARGQSMSAIQSPLTMLLWVVAIGLLFCVGAAVMAMREPLLQSLRSER